MEGRISKKTKCPQAGEWFLEELFSTIRGNMHVVRFINGIAPSRSGLNRPGQRFYIAIDSSDEGSKFMKYALLGALWYLVYVYTNDIEVNIFPKKVFGEYRAMLDYQRQ